MTENPKIRLAGKEFDVPEMAIRQNRHIEVLAIKNREYFLRGQGLAGMKELYRGPSRRLHSHSLLRAHPFAAEPDLRAVRGVADFHQGDHARLANVPFANRPVQTSGGDRPRHGGSYAAVDWDGIVAELSYCLGQPWDYVEDNITVSRIAAYRAYWLKHPPTHLCMAAWIKYKPPAEPATPEPPSLPDIEE